MIRLDLNPSPRTVELMPGISVTVRRATAVDIQAAFEASQPGLPVNDAPAIDPGTADPLFSAALARRVITAWDGVTGEDDKPAPVTPAYVDALMAEWTICKAFFALVVVPILMEQAEKKGSPPSQNGTPAGAGNIADPAPAPAPNAPAA